MMSGAKSYPYKFYIIYERKRGRESLEFAEYLYQELIERDRDVKGYIADRHASLVNDIFKEFADTVKSSEYTICVFNEPYLKSGFSRFQNMAAFTELLERKDGSFIPLAVGVEKEDVIEKCPNLTVNEISKVPESYKTDTDWIEKIKKQLFGEVPVNTDTAVNEQPYPQGTPTSVSHQGEHIMTSSDERNTPSDAAPASATTISDNDPGSQDRVPLVQNEQNEEKENETEDRKEEASKECHDLTSHDTESGDGQEPNTTSAPEVETLIMGDEANTDAAATDCGLSSKCKKWCSCCPGCPDCTKLSCCIFICGLCCGRPRRKKDNEKSEGSLASSKTKHNDGGWCYNWQCCSNIN